MAFKTVKKIFGIMSIICYLLIFVYVLLIVPMLFGLHPVAVYSGSMEPAIEVGSIIYYKEVAFEDIKEGDVVTYILSGEENSTHRVISVDTDKCELTTKGDSNNQADKPISYSKVKGRVAEISEDAIFQIPFLGRYTTFVNNNLWLCAVVFVIIATNVILPYIKIDSLVEEDKDDRFDGGVNSEEIHKEE